MSNHDRHGQHRYGSLHKKVRRHFLQRMKRGEVFCCWRCGKPITGPVWDLGHVDSGRVWVEFRGPSAEQFVRLVGRANPGLAAQMLPCEGGYDGGWRYSTLPHRLGDGELAFTISVFFPRSDLGAVVGALEQAREAVA